MTMLSTANETTDLRAGQSLLADAADPGDGPSYWALIDRSDDALLDFDTAELEHDIDHARALLAQHPTTYRNHLAIAKFIDEWIARISHDAKPCRFNEGFVQALVEMKGHLRDGDFAASISSTVGRSSAARTTRIA